MSFLAELRRRNVIRMAGLYLVGAWLITQVAGTVLPMFEAPLWLARSVVLLLAIGFVPAMIIAWVFELTPDGLKRDAEVAATESIAPQTARRMDRMIIVLLLLALGYFAVDKFVLEPTGIPTPDDANSHTDASTVSEEAPKPQEASIAVLPFADMSQAKDQEYFSDGLSEEILNLLVQIRDLKVIGRTSSFAFKGRNEDLRSIGNTLGVAYLLEGSVRKAGDDLRITAQLIKVADGSHLWSQSYDRKLENVFAIQSEIAASIAQALKINLLDAGQSMPVAQVAASLPAYDLFLQARRLIHGRTRGGMAAARGLLEEALKLDPNYAPALAALAQTVLLLNNQALAFGDLPLDQATALAQPLLDKALALDPQLAEAHTAQSHLYSHQRQFQLAEAALAKALALNPNLPEALIRQATMLGGDGRLREQLVVLQRVDAIDPLNVANLMRLNAAYQAAGQGTEAHAVTARMIATFPDNPLVFGAQTFHFLDAGQLAQAQVPVARMLALGSNWSPNVHARVHYTLGDFDQALSVQGSVWFKLMAMIALGRYDEAVAAAQADFAAAPEDPDAAARVLSMLVWTGRFDEALALHHKRWGNLAALDAYFGPTQSGAFAAIAAAQRATGDEKGLPETLGMWRKRLDFQNEQGYASTGFLMNEARYFALAGERDAAVAKLTLAIDLGFRDPLLGRDPAFAELRADAAFKAQITRTTELINIERAKLDMAPLP